jgi:hypothetical protein
MASFGEGLGAVIGGAMAADHLEEGVDRVSGLGSGFSSSVQPFREFGQSFLPKATGQIDKITDVAGDVQGYNDFMKDYQTSDAARYDIAQGTEAVNNSAAARGKLLSGGNERALATMQQGIASKYANTAYDQYLKGNNQQFGQLETALGNMFGAIGVGTTATGQEASVTTGQMNAQASLSAAQAKNDQSKGSGFGSMFSGLGSLATMF